EKVAPPPQIRQIPAPDKSGCSRKNLSPVRAEGVGPMEDNSPFVPTLENGAILAGDEQAPPPPLAGLPRRPAAVDEPCRLRLGPAPQPVAAGCRRRRWSWLWWWLWWCVVVVFFFFFVVVVFLFSGEPPRRFSPAALGACESSARSGRSAAASPAKAGAQRRLQGLSRPRAAAGRQGKVQGDRWPPAF